MDVMLLGMALFFGVHSVAILAPAWRERTLARVGEGTWKGVYSLIALVGLVLIVWGYGIARQEPVLLYQPPVWLRYVAIVLLLPVFPLLLATYLPGAIQRTVRHPMLAAVKLWATAHLLANGTLADVVLFGGFLAWAIADRISLKHRAEPSVPRLPAGRSNDELAVVGGLVLYALFLVWLHEWLIGTPAFPL